jgi:hypothetical protein
MVAGANVTELCDVHGFCAGVVIVIYIYIYIYITYEYNLNDSITNTDKYLSRVVRTFACPSPTVEVAQMLLAR